MSHACLAEAFAPATAKYHEDVRRATWGHLAPRKRKTYRGHVVFAVGCFGSDDLNPTPLECEFKGLDSSPWFYDALTEFLGEFVGIGDGHPCEAGGVYRWEGTFRNYEFVGNLEKLVVRKAGAE